MPISVIIVGSLIIAGLLSALVVVAIWYNRDR